MKKITITRAEIEVEMRAALANLRIPPSSWHEIDYELRFHDDMVSLSIIYVGEDGRGRRHNIAMA